MDDTTVRDLLEYLRRDIDRLRDDIRNPQPPVVPLGTFEEARQRQGERIGELERRTDQIERSLRTANYVAWTAIVFPTLVGTLVLILRSAIT